MSSKLQKQLAMKSTQHNGGWCLRFVLRGGRRLIRLWRSQESPETQQPAAIAFRVQRPKATTKLPVTFACEADFAFSQPVRVRRPRATKSSTVETAKKNYDPFSQS
jgi:hypothetical protein